MCWSPDVGDGLLVQYQVRVVRLAAGLVGVEGQHFGSVARSARKGYYVYFTSLLRIPIT